MALVWRRLCLGLVVFAAVAAAVLLARDVLFDWDGIGIEAERSRRVAQAALRLPLPGTPDLVNLPGRLAEQGVQFT